MVDERLRLRVRRLVQMYQQPLDVVQVSLQCIQEPPSLQMLRRRTPTCHCHGVAEIVAQEAGRCRLHGGYKTYLSGQGYVEVPSVRKIGLLVWYAHLRYAKTTLY